MSETPIESRQLIGWWRDAVSDAITSSAYTGECAIHSDFSAFTKRSHCPSLLRFSGPNWLSVIIHLHFGDCLSGVFFLLAVKCHGVSPLSIAREDPHSKCIKCLGFSHARDAVYGTSKCKICEDIHLITLRSRLVRRNLQFFPVAPQAPPQPLVKPRPGVRMLSSRRWRVSRQASPFLSRVCTREFTSWIRAWFSIS